jgi:hypothetical protein
MKRYRPLLLLTFNLLTYTSCTAVYYEESTTTRGSNYSDYEVYDYPYYEDRPYYYYHGRYYYGGRYYDDEDYYIFRDRVYREGRYYRRHHWHRRHKKDGKKHHKKREVRNFKDAKSKKDLSKMGWIERRQYLVFHPELREDK